FRFVRACSTASRLSLARTPSVSPEFKIIGGPVSSNSIYATTPWKGFHPLLQNIVAAIDDYAAHVVAEGL
ncbi:hypothetical protein, partial [Ralstonia pseudosolanacearum]|uniref:hypothetical protein n=1 Tax=Ralstonia pseudosolanacearum TaxID=1310165 RepID=UPI0020045D74